MSVVIYHGRKVTLSEKLFSVGIKENNVIFEALTLYYLHIEVRTTSPLDKTVN
jgi:hypothetical protein